MDNWISCQLDWQPERELRDKPLYRAIASRIEEDIRAGKLREGDRLPAQRELADYWGVNLSTVTKALQWCENRGYLDATVGRGTFVAHWEPDERKASPESAAGIDLGVIHPLYQQNRLLAEAIREVAEEIGIEQYLEYYEPKRKRSHRQIGAEWLRRMRLPAEPEEVSIASGTQNALAVTLMALFKAGDAIGVDALTYSGFSALASMLGIGLVPVEADEHGMNPEQLEAACVKEHLKGLYLMPECQNPTALTLPENRRRELAEIARRYGLILIEDDHYSFLENTACPPVSALLPERSVYIAGTSKSLSPGLRVAFMKTAPDLRGAVEQGLYNINLTTSHFNMEVVARLAESGLADKIMTQKRREAERRSQLAEEVGQGLVWQGNLRDYFRWLLLPPGWTGHELELRAAAMGIRLYGAERFFIGKGEPPAAARISLSAASSLQELENGLSQLRRLLSQPPGVLRPLV